MLKLCLLKIIDHRKECDGDVYITRDLIQSIMQEVVFPPKIFKTLRLSNTLQ